MRQTWLPIFVLLVTAVTISSCSPGLPAIQGLELDTSPSGLGPLAAQVSVQTDRPTTVVLELDDGERNWSVEPDLARSTRHVVPILGLRPELMHTIRVVVTDENGRTSRSQPLVFTTDPLP
jgi:hypothetical protein